MSESDLPDTRKDKPRFRRPEQRRRVALAKYYGTGSDGEWSIAEIAEYLRVAETTVEDYIWDTEMGDKARDMFPAAEERMKMDILLEKKDRLDKLREMFDEKLDEKKAVVTGHQLESVHAEVSMADLEGVRGPTGEEAPKNRIRLDAPHPSKFDSVSVFGEELRALLREIREHENDIREMLSLDEPDEVEQSQAGDTIVEQKIYNFDGADDGLPDAEIIDVNTEEVNVDEVNSNE